MWVLLRSENPACVFFLNSQKYLANDKDFWLRCSKISLIFCEPHELLVAVQWYRISYNVYFIAEESAEYQVAIGILQSELHHKNFYRVNKIPDTLQLGMLLSNAKSSSFLKCILIPKTKVLLTLNFFRFMTAYTSITTIRITTNLLVSTTRNSDCMV